MNFFSSIVILELFLGGGGRLTSFGPVTLRMVLFAMCIIYAIYKIINSSYSSTNPTLANVLVLMCLLLHLPAIILGVFSGSGFNEIMPEIQQTLFWLMAPFFAIAVSDLKMINRVIIIIKFVGITLAMIYLVVILGLIMGVIDFQELYLKCQDSGEFFFRSGNFFFYKGFLYLGIATVFLFFIKSKLSRTMLIVTSTALVLTLTRGFILATALAIIFLLVIRRRWQLVSIISIVAAVAVFMVFIYLPSLETDFLNARDISNNTRIDDLTYIIANFKISTFIFGMGFGSLINGKPFIENSFLWIFWKQGIAGLIFWLTPLVLSVRYFRRIPDKSPFKDPATAFIGGTILIYIETQTNPYLNNPIGLSFVLISLFSLKKIAEQSRLDYPNIKNNATVESF